jgi:hypothetical protein
MSSFERQPGLFQPASRPPREDAAVEDLQAQYRQLRLVLNLALASVLVLSIAVNLFIGKQMRLVRAKVRESRPLVQRMAADYDRKEPSWRRLMGSLQSYAFTHPEFHPILSKYTNALPQFFVTAVRAPTPVPGASLPAPPKSPGK